MRRSAWGRKPALFFLFGLLLSTLTAQAQQGPEIIHQGIDCMVVNKHATIRATVNPATDLRVLRIYFRSFLYSTFYFIEMTPEGDVFQAVLPRPKPETPRVVYYIEAVTTDFNTSRTSNFEPEVRPEGECDPDDVVPGFFEGDPNIIIGLTQAGIPAIPPGFEALGFAGGGISRTTGIIIGGAGAGAAAGILIGTGGSDTTTTTTTTTPPSTTTSTSTTTSAPSGSGPVACFTTDPAPPRIKVNETVRFDGSCSTATSGRPPNLGGGLAQTTGITRYDWDFGDGRAGRDGERVQRTYFDAGTFTATLTVTNQAGLTDQAERDVIVEEQPTTTTSPTTSTTSTTTTIPNEADMAVSKGGPASVATNTNFNYTINVSNAGPMDGNTVQVVDSLPAAVTLVGASVSPAAASTCVLNFVTPSVTCNSGSVAASSSFTITITVTSPAASGTLVNNVTVSSASPPDPNGGNNAASRTTAVALLAPEFAMRELDTSVTSALEAPPPDGRLKGQVSINGQQNDRTDNSSPFRHPYSGLAGENVVEAYLLSGNTEEGRWRFDFREADYFVRGSIRVDSGQVISVGVQEVVFRVTGTSGPRIRFRYRLRR